MKFTILIIAQLSGIKAHSYVGATITTIHLQNSSFCKTENAIPIKQ